MKVKDQDSSKTYISNEHLLWDCQLMKMGLDPKYLYKHCLNNLIDSSSSVVLRTGEILNIFCHRIL